MTLVRSGDVELLAVHVLFFSICSLVSRMLSVISEGWIWGGCVTGVTQPLHLTSHAVLRLVCLNLITLRSHCLLSCVVSNKMFYIWVCFSLFQIVRVVLFVSMFVFVFFCWISFVSCCSRFCWAVAASVTCLPWFYLLFFRMSENYFLKVFDGLEVPVRGWTFYLVLDRFKLSR